MSLVSSKSSISKVSLPRNLSLTVYTVGGLALFVILASYVLVSQPIGSAVSGYFYGVENSKEVGLSIPPVNLTSKDTWVGNDVNVNDKKSQFESDSQISAESNIQVPLGGKNVNVKDKKPELESDSQIISTESNIQVPIDTKVDVSSNSSSSGTVQETKDPADEHVPRFKSENSSLSASNDVTTAGSSDSGCDLYQGSWFYDEQGPLYTNNSCPVITQMQNCQGNGRPDKEYENWRWKPSQCDLPRFDGRKFLELMRGKTLAFIGDSVARNQMESMLCILWQVEAPKNRGNKRMQRYYFRSTSTMIVRIWSSWLVHKTNEAIDFAPEGVDKLRLDAPDANFMEFIPNFDVIVLSSGHWFAKQSAYVLNDEVVGGQLWCPDKSKPMKVNNVDAFGISVETILTALATHPNYTGLTIVRTFSPDHYEGGAWNTGGSCTGKTKPLGVGELVENGFTNTMHEKQVMGFNRAVKKKTNKSKLSLLDVTEVFAYRHDGHPGPYRSPDPNKLTKRGPDGRPPPQDCLHWCMPGPVDTWNEFVLEIIRREYEGSSSV